MAEIIYRSELYHHGIKGQKWGVRRFQNENGSLTPAGKERYLEGVSGKKDPKYLKYYTKEDNKKFNAQYVKGAALIAAGLVTAYGAYKVAEADIPAGNITLTAGMLLATGGVVISATNQDKKYRKEFVDKTYEESPLGVKTVSEIPKSKTDYAKEYFGDDSEDSYKKLIDNVNHNEWPDNPNRVNNCMMCTTATIMKLKGYDVTANQTKHGYGDTQVKQWFPDAKVEQYSFKKQGKSLENVLKSQGDGAYGNIMVTWAAGGGHSMVYTVKNGKVDILCSQSGQKYSLNDLRNSINPNGTSFARLDNVEPGDYVIGCLDKA